METLAAKLRLGLIPSTTPRRDVLRHHSPPLRLWQLSRAPHRATISIGREDQPRVDPGPVL